MAYERTPIIIGLFVGFVVFQFFSVAAARADDALSSAVTASAGSNTQSASSQSAAPDFILPALNRDEPVRLSAYRGKTVYLDFWSAWCQPCREAMPLQARLKRELATEAFEIVTVNVDVHPEDGRRLLARHPADHPVAIDITGAAADEYGVSTLPATFLIDGDGVLRSRLPRLNPESFPAIISTIRAALAQRAEQES